MPIYIFQCEKCEEEFEELVLGKDEVVCPNCQSKELKKIPAESNFTLVGKGWSKDGYCKIKQPKKRNVDKELKKLAK